MTAPPSAARAQPRLWFTLWGWTCAALVLVWATLLVAAWVIGHHEAEEVTDGQLEAVARLWLDASPDGVSRVRAPWETERPRAYVQEVAVIEWQQGRLLTDTHGLAGSAGLSSTPPGPGYHSIRGELDGHPVHWRVFTARSGHDDGRAVSVLMDIEHRIDLGRDITMQLARPALLVLPLVALLLGWAIRRGLRPLTHLSEDVAALDAQAGDRLGAEHRYREFTSTVQAINGLVDRLQEQARREREFASDVAHELRTPLASLALQSAAASQDPSAERLHHLEQEALRAGRILQQLLDLARAQRDPVARTDLSAVAAALVAEEAPAAFAAGQEVSLAGADGPIWAAAPPMLVELALRNLIVNAVRHTPAGTQIGVELFRDGGWACASVSDDGQRPGAARHTAASPGLGLGLRLVQRMAEQQGGSLLRDTGEPPFTTRFSLRWPVGEQPGSP